MRIILAYFFGPRYLIIGPINNRNGKIIKVIRSKIKLQYPPSPKNCASRSLPKAPNNKLKKERTT